MTRFPGNYIVCAGLVVAAILAWGWLVQPDPTIYLIGDSTMADKPLTGSPERGWGQVFALYVRPEIHIENHAKNGRSTKSFIKEGRWEEVRNKLKPGDYVLIQFGHNDEKKEDSTRFADAHTDFKSNLSKFVRETEAKGAHPVLITQVVRRRFDSAGTFYDVHGDYPGVVREVGSEENIPVIDLHRKSMSLLERLGEEESKKLFLHVGAGEFSAMPGGKRDDTHFCWYGASVVARLVVDEIRELHLPLEALLIAGEPPEFVGMGRNVLLDCFYNNEWKKDAEGKLIRYHYMWSDTANSGYSILATTLSRLGCTMDTLNHAPSADALRHAGIYMIVDPDTPQETESPNYINQNDIDAITQWVQAGGVLMLMGNDKGNAEFEHLNDLSGRFGIHFNEDSRNRVQGAAFGAGTFDSFPEHPLFKGVRRIFIKELSTLRLQDPAHAVLTNEGDVILAFAQVGKGAVFAVGDPWLYNEYMGTWRLPDGYDNAVAANNLFRWLLPMAISTHL